MIRKISQEKRSEAASLMVERILLLIRNVLHAPSKGNCGDDEASVHDQVLWCFHHSGMEEILLYLAQEELDLCMHTVEIIALLLKEQVG